MQAYPLALVEKGRTFFKQQHYETAIGYWVTAMDFGVRYPDLYLNLGAAYHLSGQTEQAEAIWREGLSRYVGQPDLLWNLIQSLADRGQKSQVGELMEQFPEREMESPDQLIEIAKIWEDLNTDRAISIYQKILTQDPGNTVAHERLQDLTSRTP